ncbi:MAG: hypothetical protein ACYCX4_00250 [Bacillota bacterium]
MIIKKMSKKMLVTLMVALMIIGILATTAFAATQYVYINKGDGPVQSASISSTNGAYYNAQNYWSSGHSLYATLQYSNGSGWNDEYVQLMEPNTGANGASWRSGSLLWRLQLNPYLFYTDCDGYGYVSNH